MSGYFIMSVVDIDERGRMTVPKDMGLRGGRAVVLSAGTFFIVVPLKGDPYDFGKDWLKTDKETLELKRSSESQASEDAVMRAKRKGQIC